MGKGMTLAEFRAQTTEEQRNEIYNASVSGGTEKVRQLASNIGNNRGNAPVGNAANGGMRVTVLNPDSSAFAANAKDRHNETQRPWYKVGMESYQNADNSAHAQAEKDDEADKNPLFHQWKTAFDRQQEEKATQNQAKINGLQKELDELDANSAYITTSDQYDEYQNRRTEIVDEMVSLGGDGKGSGERALSNAWNKTKDFFKGTGSRTTEGFTSAQAAEYNRLLGELDELDANATAPADIVNNERERSRILSRLHELDAQAGREERTYDSRERVGAFFKSWGTGTGASYTNAAGNVNEITTSAQGMEREIAELEAQAARAQTAYDEAVQQYGEAGATFEKNLLIEAQQRLEAKKAQYAGMEKERAYDAKAQTVSQKLYDTADRLLTQSEQEMAKAKYGASGFGSFALDAAKTGLDVAADTALSAVGVPGLANMAVRVYGSEAQQARLQGDDAQTAAAKGLKSALIEVATEKIAGPFEKAYGKTALSSTINKAVDKLNASGLLKWAADTAGEGFEEGMSDVLNIVADHMMGWDSGENSVWGDIAADKDEIMYDMLLGAFVGAFGATGNAIGTSVNTSPTAQAQTQVEQAAPVQTAPTQAETTQQAAANNAPSQLNIDNGSARAYNNTNVNVANNTGGMTDVAGRSVEADSGRVSGVYRGRDTIHRGEEKSSGAGVGSGLVLLSPQAKDTLAKRGVAVVETQDVSNDKPAFSAALDAARANDSVNGWAVTPKSVAELEESGAKLIMSANGTTGLAIAPDGDIEAVFANKAAGAPKGATKTTIPQAIANGGTKLDCYGDGLVTLYSQYGFVPVARVKFNPEYANQGWDASKGTPDIFFMMYNGDSADTVVQKMGTYKYPTDAELNALPVMDYDEAYSYRDSLLANSRKATDAVQPTGDISTSPTAQNVKQGDSGALNNAVNYNSGETAAETPSQAQKNTAPTQETGNFEGEETKYRSNLGKGNGTRTTQTVETINNANITTDAQREQLSPYVKNGKFDYIPDTNKAQTERAANAIEKNGWEASRRDFHDAVIQGKSSADLVAQGAMLMNNASASNASASEYLDLANDYIELLHRAGETLQAGKILQQLTPEGRLYCMQKTVKQINKSLTKGQRKTIAKAQEGSNYKNIDIDDIYTNYEVKLDESLVDEYINAETDEQRDTVISQIQQNIADQMPSTFVDKWNALRYVNMLGNFKTQERNLLGNTAMLVTQTAKNRVKAAAEVTANLFRAEDNQIERTASFLVGRELRKEAAADFENIKDIARGEGKYNDSQSYTNDIKNKRRIFNSELLEKYRKVTNWAMDAGDVIFLKANYADALGGWLKAHGISSIEDATPEQLDRGRAYAIKEAQEATFRDDNIVSKNVAKIGRNPVTEGIMPFRKTPANVAVRALEYSPIGIAETIYKGVQTKRGNANANEVINSLSKNILGTGLAMAGYALAKAGFARGSEDDDDLDMFQKMQGKQDYAVKIGDEWISLSQLAPNSVPLYMGVMLYEALDGGGLTWDNAYQILGCLNDPLMDMSMLSGVNDALSDVVTYGDDGTMLWKVLGNAILSYLTQGINNTLIGQAEQAWEKNRQTVYSDKDSILPSNVQYKLGKTLGKIPGVDYHQQDYIDAWGRTQSNGEPSKRIIDALLNPFYTSKDSTAEVDAELERLYKAGKNVDGFPNVLPQKASRSMEYVKGRAMTPDEYKQYSIDRGQKSLELVSGFMNSAEYDNLSDQQRAEVISDLYSLAAQQAINKVKAANGLNETTMNKYKGVSDENMPEYLAARQVFSDAALDKDGTDYSAVDAMVENFNSYSPEVQQKLMSDGYNVTDLVYADKLGQDAATYYGCKAAIEKNADKLGGTDAAKAISVYNYMHDMGKSDAEVLATAKAQLKPDAGGQQNATIRRMEAYMTAASKNNYDANLGEWLNLVASVSDADDNGGSPSKENVQAGWAALGLTDNDTYAGVDVTTAYNILKSSKSLASNAEYATQIDDVYAALVPAQEKTKYQLAGSVTRFTNSGNTQGQTGSAAQYTSPIDFLLANTPYAAYK